MGVLYYDYIEKHLRNYYKFYVKMHTVLLKKVTILLYYFYLTFCEILKMFKGVQGVKVLYIFRRKKMSGGLCLCTVVCVILSFKPLKGKGKLI